jgi:hypothetical protein
VLFTQKVEVQSTKLAGWLSGGVRLRGIPRGTPPFVLAAPVYPIIIVLFTRSTLYLLVIGITFSSSLKLI